MQRKSSCSDCDLQMKRGAGRIAAMGGKGNIPGVMVDGIVMGLIEKAGALFFGDKVAQIFAFQIVAIRYHCICYVL